MQEMSQTGDDYIFAGENCEVIQHWLNSKQ